MSFRNWSRLDFSAFRHYLEHSSLFAPADWENLSVSDLASLYTDTLGAFLDKLLPFKTSRFPLRPSNLWFNEECHDLKRNIRRLERYLNCCVFPSSDLLRQLTVQRSEYRHLLRIKRSEFWRSRFSSQHRSPRSFWQSVDELMGRCRPPPTHNISSTDFQDFFLTKINNVRHQTSVADPPIFLPAKNDCRLLTFRRVSETDVFHLLLRLPDKYSKSDPIPTSILKCCADLLTPFLTFLFNRSLLTGSFPSAWKRAFVSPIPKKFSSNDHDPSNYRPISHMCTLSKMLEKSASLQLLKHVNDHHLLPQCQSAYRKHFSCETAVLKVASDMLKSFDEGKVGLMAFLDLSSAFDCVEHSTLIRRLHLSYGLSDTCLKWFRCFLEGREMAVSHISTTSFKPVLSGVPQGSVLGPILFSLYVSDIVPLAHAHSLSVHLFADDIIIYGSACTSSMSSLSSSISQCFDEVGQWLKSNGLLLNSDKSNVMWCSSLRRRLTVFPPVILDNSPVSPVNKVKYLGVVLDSNFTFHDNINLTTRSCFSLLRRIRSIRNCLTTSMLSNLINSLVFSRLDYCISIHSGLPANALWKLQRVLHASARLLHGIGRSEHISAVIRDQGWLPIPQRIDLRLACLTFKCLNDSAPDYLSEQLNKVASVVGRHHLRSAAAGVLAVPRVRCRTLGGRSFRASATSAWNRLPSDIRKSSPSFTNFRYCVKSFLLSL